MLGLSRMQPSGTQPYGRQPSGRRPSGRRRLRYLAPVAAAAAIGVGTWIPTLSASASPKLPNQTVDQLIARAEQPPTGGFTGTVEWTANLGLPSLSGVTSTSGTSGAGFDWTTLLSGSHQVKVWDGARNGQRLALIEPSSEMDLYTSSDATGHQTWVYDSAANKATHLVPAAGRAGSRPAAGPREASAGPALTPQQVAQKVLTQVKAVTTLSVSPATYVAGQPAYVLSLVPKASGGAASSTIGRIDIAVDADNGAVLRVGVTAHGARTPALSVGFTAVQFQKLGSLLPASAFAFTPPSGTSVSTQTVGGHGGHRAGARSGGPAPTTVGSAWDTVAILHGGHAVARAASSTSASSTAVGGRSSSQAALKPHGRHGRRHGMAGADQQLAAVTTPVSGSFGTGRLLSTSLVNVIVLSNGEVAAGFVTPQALEAAVSPAG